MSRRSLSQRKKTLSLRFRHLLEAWAMRAFVGFFKMLGPDRASNLGGKVLRTLGPKFRNSRVARSNIKLAFPHLDDQAVEEIVKQSWENLGRVAGEFPHMDWIMKNRVQVENKERIHQLRDDGQPGIIVSAHMANWEIGGAVSGNEGLSMAVVFRTANNPGVQELYTKYRNAFTQSQQIAKGRNGAREIMKLLRSGGHVAILADQKLSNGISVPFFGHDAMTTPAVAQFAQFANCPVVPARTIRLDGCHFKLIMEEEIPMPNTGDKDADIRAMTLLINQKIEEWIRAEPGQWLWMHKRWRNRKGYGARRG